MPTSAMSSVAQSQISQQFEMREKLGRLLDTQGLRLDEPIPYRLIGNLMAKALRQPKIHKNDVDTFVGNSKSYVLCYVKLIETFVGNNQVRIFHQANS